MSCTERCPPCARLGCRGDNLSRFKLGDIFDAYDTFGRAAETKALKVITEA